MIQISTSSNFISKICYLQYLTYILTYRYITVNEPIEPPEGMFFDEMLMELDAGLSELLKGLSLENKRRSTFHVKSKQIIVLKLNITKSTIL